MLENLRRGTEAIVNRKPRDECFVWAESLALRMQSMPVPQRSLFRLRAEQLLYEVQYPATQLTTNSNALAAAYNSQCEMTDTQYTPMTNVPFFQN